MISRGRRGRTDAQRTVLRMLAVACVLLGASAAAQADGDPFELFPGLRAQAGFSCQDLTVSGDAVVSSLGLATGDAEAEQGHLRSNGDITLVGGVEVHGDVLAGPGGQVDLNGGPLVTGTIGNADADLACFPVDLAALEAALDQANDNDQIPLTSKGKDVLGGRDHRDFKIVGNDSLRIPAGTYIFNSFDIGGGSTVEVDGEVRILVTGTVKITGGGLFNQAGSPFLLRLWTSGATFKVDSQFLLRGFVYAPDASLVIRGGAEVQGAIFTGSLDIGGGGLLTRIIDDAPPQLEITSPTDGDTLTECEVEVTGTVADAETGVTLTINQIPVEVAEDGSFSARVSLWTDPPGTIHAEATDGAGNTTIIDIQVTVLLPVVSLESPLPGSLVGTRMVDLAGTAGTATEVTVNGVPAVVADGLWQIASFDLGEDGIKPLEIVGLNCAGSTVVSASLDLDTLPPELAIISPAEGEVFSEGVVTVVGTVFDAHLSGLTVNGIPAAVQGGAFSVADVPLVEGENILTAEAVDQLGRSTQAVIMVLRRSLPPQVAIDLPAPARDQCLEGGLLYTIGGAYWSTYPSTGEDGAPPAVALRVVTSDGAASDHAGVVASDGRSWSVENVSLGDDDGVAVVTVTATNADGKRALASRSFRVDGGPPTVELTLDGGPFPASGPGAVPPDGVEPVLFGRALGIRAMVSDGPLGAPPSAVLELDGAPYAAGTPITSERDHLVVATVTDCAGNTASAYAFFRIDLTAPALLGTMPEDGALLGSGVETFAGTADSDLATTTVNGVEATVVGAAFTLGPFEWREGLNRVEIVLTDAAGNAATFEHGFTVRSIEPTVEIVIGGLPIPADTIFTRPVAPEVRTNDPDATVSATLNSAAFISGSLIDQGGVYTVEATATDALGRTADAAASFEVDLAGDPSIAIISPADGEVLTEAVVTVAGTVDGRDPSVTVNGVAAVVNGSAWSAADLALDPDVLNILTAGVKDGAGRTASASISVMVDTGGPQVLILEPSDGLLTNRRSIDVAGVVVGGARRTADGTLTVAGISTLVAADGAFRTLDVPLTGGPNTIVAEAVDEHGRIGADSVTIHGDLEPPTIFLLADGQPLADGATFGGPITLGVEVADDAGVPPAPEVRLNGRLQAVSGPAVEIPVAEDGGYAVAVAAVDLAGNERRVERAFSISGGGCALSDLDPSSGSVVAGNAVTIRGRGGGATAVTVRVPEPGTDPVQYQEYPAQLADGTFVAGDVPLPEIGDNNLEIECTDAAGTAAVAELLIHRLADGDGPVVKILVPGDGDLTAARTVTVEGTVSDGGARVTVSGLAAAVEERPDGSGVFSADVPLAEGPNILVARAADAAGRTGRDRVVAWLDTRAPELRIITPESSSWLGPAGDGGAAVDVTGLVDLHTESNLDAVTVTTSLGLVTAVVDPATGVFTAAAVPLDPALAPADTQTITAAATDTIGNEGTSSIGVHFDADGPSLVLMAPPDLERYSETSPTDVPVVGDAWAAEGAQISVNGATLDPLDLVWDGPGVDGRFHADFSTAVSRPVEDGVFGVVARVTELDGRWAGTRRLLTVDGTPPKVLETFPANGDTGVDPNSLLLVLFSEPILRSSLTEADGLVLTRLHTGDPVVGQVAVAGNAVAFVAGAELAAGTEYRLRVGTDVVDLVGHPLEETKEISFTTSAGDGAPPLLDPLAEVMCDSKLEVLGTTAANATVRVVDGDLAFTGFADVAGHFEVIVPLTHDGFHLLRVAVVDRDGASGPEATAVVRVDCNAPTVMAARLDADVATIHLELSEPIDPATATIGTPDAAIRLFDDEDPGGADQDGTVQVSAGGEAIDVLLDSASDAWWRDTVIRLVVDAPLADPQGNAMAAPYVARLFPSGGEGVTGSYLLGEAYDDTTGRPLEGVTVRLFASGAALPGSVAPGEEDAPVAVAVTDARGRFQIVDAVGVGRYSLVLEADGFTRVVRQLALEPTVGTIAFDCRLTPLGDAVGVLDPVAGGRLEHPSQPLLALEADPAAVPGLDPVTVHLAPRTGQGLPDFLPLGWTPVAVADLLLGAGGAPLPDGDATSFAPDGVHLELPLPEWVQPGDSLLAVRYRLAGGAWLTLADVELIDGPEGEPLARVPLVGPGTVAVVLPDEGATAPPVPAAGINQILRGVARPSELPELDGNLVLDPARIPATGRSRAAVIARSVDGETPWPSGTAVQAYLSERLLLSGGGELVEAPYVTDLLLYRPRLEADDLGDSIADSVGAVEFMVSPSARAAAVLLEVGYEEISLYPFPDQLERGQVLGPAGGTVSSSDGVELELPEGALTAKTAVSARLLSAQELGALPAVLGFDTLAAIMVDLGGETLARRATLSLDTPEVTPEAIPGDSRLVLAELVEIAADGRGSYPKLAARMTREAGAGIGGRLQAAPEPAGSGLPLQGIVREGVYLVLSAQGSIGYATGFVSTANGFGLQASRVTADGLGTADVSPVGGRYSAVAPTAPGAVLTAKHPTLDEDGTAEIPAIQPNDIVVLDITVVPVPPEVDRVEPSAGETGVAVLTPVEVYFTERLDPASVGPGTLSLVLADANGNPTGAFVKGSVGLSSGGDRIVFESTLPLAPGRTFIARFTGGVADEGGALYVGGPVEWSFTTSTVVAPGGQVHPELFRIRLPIDGVAEVYGDPGALPTITPGSTPWTVSPWVNSPVADPVRESFPGDATTGAFSGTVGHPPEFPVTIHSEVWVTVLDPAGGVTEFRLGVFATADGRGFVAPPDRALSFTTTYDITDPNDFPITVEVPEGAFDVATVVRVETLDPETVGVEDDLGLGLGGFVRLDFAGEASESLTLRVPAPPDAGDDALVLVGEPVSLAWGRRLRLLAVGGVLTDYNGSYLTNDASVQPPIPDLTQGGQKAAGSREIFVALRESANVVWYYEPTVAKNTKVGGGLAFATFLASRGNPEIKEIFYNAAADTWVYQAPPANWSGQVVLPLIEGSPFTVERRDAATGWLLTSQEYGDPLDPDGDGVITLDALLPPDSGPPRLVDATPFDLIRFSAPESGKTQRLRLDLEATTDQNEMVRLKSPSGFDFSRDASLALYEVSNAKELEVRISPAFVCSDTTLEKAVEGGNDLLAVIGPGELDPDTFSAFSFTFSRAIEGSIDQQDAQEVARLTDLGESEGCQVGGGQQLNLEVETAYEDRTLLIRPSGGLALGRRYKLEIFSGWLFPNDCPSESEAEGKVACATPKTFLFTTRSSSDTIIAEGGGRPGLEEVRTTEKIGNLFFSGTVDGRILVTDLTGGANPVAGILTPHAEMNQGASSQIRSMASDGHGRIFFSARFGGTWAIKALAVEDVLAGGTFNPKFGGVRTAYALGSDVGTLSEFLAISALPLATPVDMDVLVRDKIDEATTLEEFCQAQSCAAQLESTPDAAGFYSISLDTNNLIGRPQPLEREDHCDRQPNTDKVQRISIDNVDTGDTWSVDHVTSEWGGSTDTWLEFKARSGDRIRLRYNLQTLGFVALLGSGITVVDLNRFYDDDTPLEVFTVGHGQCGRRLGKYEGTDIDFEGCSPGPVSYLRYGIDMTPSVAVLGPTGCIDDSCARGHGQIHLYSPLLSMGMIHSQAQREDEEGVNPGKIRNGALICTAEVPGVFHRDIAVARDVEWVDRGLRAENPGEPFTITDQERFDKPVREVGDLLFLSLGEEGIFVFNVGDRIPDLLGRLHVPGHAAFRLQVEKELGILLAGGYDGLLDVWSLANVNNAPASDIHGDVDYVFPARPIATLHNVPWGGDRLGVDLSGTGLVYSWAGANEGVRAIPLGRPPVILVGVYRAEGEVEGDDPPPRELRPTGTLVPLGIPTELSQTAERDRREENEKTFTPAFKVRMALPGFLGGTIKAKVEGLRVKPPQEHFATTDLDETKVRPGGQGWPEETHAEVTLLRLAGETPDAGDRFGNVYNLYESDEIVLLIADPRAMEEYVAEGTPEDENAAPDADTEAGQCRRCDRPEVLTDDDEVVEMFAGGRYLRVIVDLESQPELETFFDDAGWPVPGTIAELVGWADDMPSPPQVALAEPAQNPAMWSEAGMTVSLVSGESVHSVVDHQVPGRAIGFSFQRTYRSGMVTYNALGRAGWTSNLFAHLRENKITGEVAYHDGAGNVWRFYPNSPPEGREVPNGLLEGDFWARKNTYDTREDKDSDFLVPRGLPLDLRRVAGAWQLLGLHNESLTFDTDGRLREMADRLRQNVDEDQEQGNRVRLHYDAFDRLYRVEDEYGRNHTLRYFTTTDPEDPTFGLLEEIEDFAGRTVRFGYNEHSSGEQILDQVELPEISVGFVEGGSGRPFIRYQYDDTDYGGGALVHGDLKGARLKAIRLPGRTNDTVSLTYEADTGRVETVTTPQATTAWSLDWADESPTGNGPIVTVKAPWGLDTEYHIFSYGRIENIVAKAVETIPPTGANPDVPAPGGQPAVPTRDLTTHFDYKVPGSGRISQVVFPDSSSIFNEWRKTNRMIEGTLDFTEVRRNSSPAGNNGYSVTKVQFNYEDSVDNFPGAYVDPSGQHHVLPLVRIPMKGHDPTPATESHENILDLPDEKVLISFLVVSSYLFDKWGQVEERRAGEGDTGPGAAVQTNFAYYENQPPSSLGPGYLKEEKLLSGLTRNHTYDRFGNVASSTLGKPGLIFSKTTTDYDEWDRPYSETTGEANGRIRDARHTVRTKYDPSGRVVRREWTQSGEKVTIRYYYDARDRLDKITQTGLAGESPGSSVTGETRYQYDNATGLLTSIESPGGVTESYSYDTAGRVMTVDREDTGSIHYGYDSMGRLVWTTDGDDGAWRGTHDAWGRLFKERLADGTIIERNFGPSGGLRFEKTMAPDETVLSETQYRLTAHGQPWHTIWYHGAGIAGEFEERSYDSAGRLTGITLGNNQERGADLVTTGYTYLEDGSGRLDTVTDPAGNSVDYGYVGAEPWPNTVKYTEAVQDESPIVTNRILRYDGQGRVVSTSWLNGVNVYREFDEVGNLKSRKLAGANPNQETKMSWDSAGRLTRREDVGRPVQTFGYDPDGRIKVETIVRHDETDETTSYEYDDAGRLWKRTMPGLPGETFTYHPDDTLDKWTTALSNGPGGPQLKLAHAYDEAGNLIRRYVENASVFTPPPEGLASIEDLGDAFEVDRLGRVETLARVSKVGASPDDDELEGGSKINYQFKDRDPRNLPWKETVGVVDLTWPAEGTIVRTHGVHGFVEDWVGPNGIGTFGGTPDALQRRTAVRWPVETKAADSGTYLWGGTSRVVRSYVHNFVQSSTFGGSEGRLLQRDTRLYGADVGGLRFSWNEPSNLKTKRETVRGGVDFDVFGGLDWGWGHDGGVRLASAESSIGLWSYGYGLADELIFKNPSESPNFYDANGPMGRIESATVDGETEIFSYDSVGRRTGDGRHLFTWSWRGELVSVEVIDPESELLGHRVDYEYDAAGRLARRRQFNDQGDFERGRLFIWNDSELVAQVGLNYDNVPLWRVEHLPGPTGFDDSPQLKVTLAGDGASSRVFNLVRDEMGTVTSVFLDTGVAVGERMPLKARVLYSPYGEAHLEAGPELVSIDHEVEVVEVNGVPQIPVEPITAPDGSADLSGMPGALIFDFTIAPRTDTLEGSIGILRRSDELDDWEDATLDFQWGQDEDDTSRLIVMPLLPWEPGEEYRVIITDSLEDAFGRRAVFPDGEATFEATVIVPDPVPDPAERFYRFPQTFKVLFDTAAAARARLDCREDAGDLDEPCFPGGVNLMFQGLWHDPLTGIAYARNRWYDPRTQSWLSRDPFGAFDSPNQYAFVAWGPERYTDPTGEVAGVDNLIGGVVSVGIGFGLTCAFESCGEYTWADAGVDFGLGALTSGLSNISKLKHLGKVGRFATRAGAEAGLDIGAEVVRHELKGEDYTLSQLAIGSVVNFGIGEAGAAGGRRLGGWFGSVAERYGRYSSRSRPIRGQFLEDVFETKMVRQGAGVFPTRAGRVGIDLGTVEGIGPVLNEVKFVNGLVGANQITSFGLHYAPGVTSQRSLARNVRRGIAGAMGADFDEAALALRQFDFSARLVGGPRTRFAQNKIVERMRKQGIENVMFGRLSRFDIMRYILRGK